jgi:hypothetical protein
VDDDEMLWRLELARGLYAAVQAARAVGAPPGASLSGIPADELAAILGGDLLPYGVEANRQSLEAAIGMAVERGILSDTAAVEQLFAPGTTES